jgi:predicted nucleotidyltransferase
METLGIIAEYNPFHNGHLYHLQKSKEITGAKHSIAIISGNFLQRGEPAILDKWTRTIMALKAGIDLVIEIPFVFASQDARGFAHAGIQLLNYLGIVDCVSFGCEESQIACLNELVELLKKEPLYFQKILKEEVKKGENYPKIREKAIVKYYKKFGTKFKNNSIEKLKELLKQPNNVLALEYMISLKNTNSSIKPFPINRIGSNYLQDKLEGKYSSATAIRERIFKNIFNNNPIPLEGLSPSMPVSSYQIILDELKKGINPITISCFEQGIFSQLRRMPIEEIKELHGIQEGLENRLKESAISSFNIENLIQKTKSKRYTRTRIQRILVHSLFNLKHKEIVAFNNKGPLYCRVLGMTENGKMLLKRIKSKSKLPIIIKLNNFYQQNKFSGDVIVQKMLNYDILATNLYVLGYKLKMARVGAQDYTRKIIILP